MRQLIQETFASIKLQFDPKKESILLPSTVSTLRVTDLTDPSNMEVMVETAILSNLRDASKDSSEGLKQGLTRLVLSRFKKLPN